MTLEKVARRARVSPATVSRVMSNKSSVSGAARARVLKAIEHLNYSPNLIARGLAGVSRSVGVIVSNLENPSFMDLCKSIEEEAERAGFDLLLANTRYSPERLKASVRLMIGRRVAGLAAVVSEMDRALIAQLNEYRIPTVFFDVGWQGSQLANIRIDYQRGIKKLIAYLYSLGHRSLGFASYHSTLDPISGVKEMALDAIEGYSDMRVETAADEDSLEGGRRAARALLAANPSLTAMICANDLMAIGALRELRESGLRVPLDVSVTGFDNIQLGQFSAPPLTSVHVSRQEIGKIIGACLIRRTPLERQVVIDPELVLRDSTGPAAIRPAKLRVPFRT